MSASSKRRWFTFRLRTLLIATAISGLLLLPAVEFVRYRREQATLKRLLALPDHRLIQHFYSNQDGTAKRESNDFIDWRSLKIDWRSLKATGVRRKVYVQFIRDAGWWGLGRRVIAVRLNGPVTLADINDLADVPNLSRFEINEAALSPMELQAIARLATVETLDLSYCQLECDDLRPLVKLRTLKSLKLQNTAVPESATIELQEAMPGLEVLYD